MSSVIPNITSGIHSVSVATPIAPQMAASPVPVVPSPPWTIPFNKPSFLGREQDYILQSIAAGQVSGDGPFSKKCHELLQKSLGVQKALLTTSCTHALEMAALLLDLQPGDEVIVPSFTFVSTVNAFVLRGAKPVFIDILPDTLNLNHLQLEALITPATKAVVPVHYAGVGCEMDVIMRICRERQIHVVEDNAHGLFARYRGQYLGTFGTFATQSYHETKNFSCGEGGALLINDAEFIERAEIIREKGTNRSRFFRGQVDKYTWVDVGSSYLPSDILAAVLYAQLETRDEIFERRRSVWEFYQRNLCDWSVENGVRLPFVPDWCEQPYHMYYLLMPDLQTRQRFIAHMKSKGILSVYHYLPLHISTMGVEFGGTRGQCPVTEEVSEQLVRLPMYNTLSVTEREQVVSAVLEFRC